MRTHWSESISMLPTVEPKMMLIGRGKAAENRRCISRWPRFSICKRLFVSLFWQSTVIIVAPAAKFLYDIEWSFVLIASVTRLYKPEYLFVNDTSVFNTDNPFAIIFISSKLKWSKYCAFLLHPQYKAIGQPLLCEAYLKINFQKSEIKTPVSD